MEGKSSTQSERFILANFFLGQNFQMILDHENFFYHQITANLPKNATKIVLFLKYIRNLGFSKSLNVANLLKNLYKMLFFQPIEFLQKN